MHLSVGLQYFDVMYFELRPSWTQSSVVCSHDGSKPLTTDSSMCWYTCALCSTNGWFWVHLCRFLTDHGRRCNTLKYPSRCGVVLSCFRTQPHGVSRSLRPRRLARSGAEQPRPWSYSQVLYGVGNAHLSCSVAHNYSEQLCRSASVTRASRLQPTADQSSSVRGQETRPGQRGVPKVEADAWKPSRPAAHGRPW